MLYKHYPDKWKQMKDIEDRLNSVGDTKQQPRWHISKSIKQLEDKFKHRDKQQVFDLDFEPLSDCFCKI